MTVQDIQNIETLLEGLGYTLPAGHADDQADAALNNAINTALNDLKGFLGISGDATDFATLRPQLDQAIQTARTNNNDYATLKEHVQAGRTLVANGLLWSRSATRRFAGRAEAVVNFVENYETYAHSMAAVQAELNGQPAPAGQPDQPTTAPQPAPLPVSDGEQTAAQGIDSDAMSAMQTFLNTAFPGQDIAVTGTWDGATKGAYLTYVSTLAGAQADLSAMSYEEMVNTLGQRMRSLQTETIPQIQAEIRAARARIEDLEASKSFEWFWQDKPENDQIDEDIQGLQDTIRNMNTALAGAQGVVSNISTFAGQIMPPLEPLLRETQQWVRTPVTPAGPTGPAGPGTGPTDPAEQQQLANSTIAVEGFLSASALVDYINSAARRIPGHDDWSMAQPDNPHDGTFDSGSEAALQQVLSLLTDGLNLTEFATSQGGVAYTPELGVRILRDIESSSNPDIIRIRTMLEGGEDGQDGIPPFEDPPGSGNMVTGARALVKHLDYLYRMQVLERQSLSNLNVPKLNGLQLGILNFILQIVTETFPNLIPALDGMMRQFTGGQGLLDFFPQLAGLDAAQPYRDDLERMDDLDPYEQLRESFKTSFSGVSSTEDMSAMQSRLVRSAKAMSSLPFGDEARRSHYPVAVQNALNAAMASLGDTQPGADGFDEDTLHAAAEAYALTFMSEMRTLENEYGDASADEDPALQVYPPEILQANLVEAGFDIDGNDSLTLAEIDRVRAAYNTLNTGAAPWDAKPLIFKDDNGHVFIVGIDQDSNLFTIEPLPVDAIDASIQGDPDKNIPGMNPIQLAATYSGYALAYNNYYSYFDQTAMVADGISDRRAITHMARNAGSFDEVVTTAQSIVCETISKPQWLQDMIDADGGPETLTNSTQTGVQLITPSDGHIRVVWNDCNDLTGADLRDELLAYAQGQDINTLETLNQISRNYPFHAQDVANSLLARPSVRTALELQPLEPAQPTVERAAELH